MIKRAQRRSQHCMRRTIPRYRAAAVSALAGAPDKIMRLDHFAWVRRAGTLLAVLVFLLAVRQFLWHRASAGLLLAGTPVEPDDSWTLSPSRIAGIGIHAARHLRRGASLGPSVVWTQDGALAVPSITEMGSMVNHASTPHSTAILAHRTGSRSSDLELVLLRDLGPGEEVTSDYLVSPAFIALPMPWWWLS
jgi:hypothetical protein